MSDHYYEQARRRVREKRSFYLQLGTFVVLSAFFFLINILTSPGHWWFMWPILGIGIGLAARYFQVFGLPGVGPADEEWEAREMEKEMRRLETGASREDELELPQLEKNKRRNWDEDELV